MILQSVFSTKQCATGDQGTESLSSLHHEDLAIPVSVLYLIVTYLPSFQVISAATTRGMVPWENREKPFCPFVTEILPHGYSFSPLILEEGADFLLILWEILFPPHTSCAARTPLPGPSSSPLKLAQVSHTRRVMCMQSELKHLYLSDTLCHVQ